LITPSWSRWHRMSGNLELLFCHLQNEFSCSDDTSWHCFCASSMCSME
jgi:hypothetical protein